MQKNKKYLISSDSVTDAMLTFLSKNTGKNKSYIVHELVSNLFQICTQFEFGFNYWCHINGSEMTCTVIGRSAIISGSISDDDDAICEQKLQDAISTKLLGQTITIEKNEQRFCIEGDLAPNKSAKG